MPRSLRAALDLAALAPLGCAGRDVQEARYIYQDSHYGAIGIPENTSSWPNNYRKQAEKLMDRHFPGQWEIVRVEEIQAGSRESDIGNSSETNLGPGAALPLNLAKLDRKSDRKLHDKVDLKECRIIYRRVDPNVPPLLVGRERFASAKGVTPTTYLDPNGAMKPPAAAKAAGEPEVLKASAEK